MQPMKARVFMTGATGVIGRRAIPLLIANGHRVTAVARSVEKSAAVEEMGADAARLDIFDVQAVRRAVADHEIVINLATHIPSSTWRMFVPGAWRENDKVRRLGSAVLTEAARDAGVGQFIQESFAPIYKDGGEGWIDEEWPLQPVRLNRSVIDAEASAARFSEGGGSGVVLRFAGFYGGDAQQTRDMIAVLRKGWAPLPGSPQSFISSISHDDAATAVVAALGLKTGIYNVTDDEPVTRREFVNSLADAFGIGRPKFAPEWLAHIGGSLVELLARSERISNRKLRAATEWTPKYPSVRAGWPQVARELAD